jgi:hypothetical protein
MAFSRLFGKSKKDPPSPSGELISRVIDTLSSPDIRPCINERGVLLTFILVLYYHLMNSLFPGGYTEILADQ